MRRRLVEHRDSELRVKKVYSSDRGQDAHDLNATAKGSTLKLGANRPKWRAAPPPGAALKDIERQCGTKRFRARFKSITVDNGS